METIAAKPVAGVFGVAGLLRGTLTMLARFGKALPGRPNQCYAALPFRKSQKVRAVDVSAGCKIPSMSSRLSALVVLISAALTLLACEPTATATPISGHIPEATEVSTPVATQTPVAEGDGGDEVTAAVQQLLDTRSRALRDDDAELLRSVMTRDLAGSCGLDQLQSWLDQDENSPREVVVRSVFVDVSDPSRAFAEVTRKEYAERPEESPTFPWPVELEDGEWRAGYLYGLTLGRCPYDVPNPPSGPDGRERDFPQIPGLDLDRHEDILSAVPGTRVVHGNFRTDSSSTGFSSRGSMAASSNQVNIYAELETDSAAAELMRLYRDGLQHPSWDILDEGSSADFGWFTWTVQSDDGRLWHGKLVVAPSHKGWKHVWFSLSSDDSDDRR